MGNCFSDAETPSTLSTSTQSHNRHSARRDSSGSKSGGAGGGHRVQMSWASVPVLRSPGGVRATYTQSKDPADYQVTGLKPLRRPVAAGRNGGDSATTGEGGDKSEAEKAQEELMQRNHQLIPWVRFPGQINDQRINIDTCSDAAILLLDHCDSVQVDDAERCLFLIGPTTGSVFIRNCKNCKFVVACGQLRLRDVKNSSFSLFCQSRPVLESSSGIQIGPFAHPGYWELRQHFAKAHLSVFNNKYTMVHDFTPKGGSNYSFISAVEAESLVPPLSTFAAVASHVNDEEECMLRDDPVVPLTHGVLPHNKPFLFIILFKPGKLEAATNLLDAVERAVREHSQPQPGGAASAPLLLVNTVEQVLTPEAVALIDSVSPLKPQQKEHLLSGGPSIAICVAADTADCPTWRTFLASTEANSAAYHREGAVASLQPLAEVVFEKIPLMGMGFGSSF